jgi:hypothetical protein
VVHDARRDQRLRLLAQPADDALRHGELVVARADKYVKRIGARPAWVRFSNARS